MNNLEGHHIQHYIDAHTLLYIYRLHSLASSDIFIMQFINLNLLFNKKDDIFLKRGLYEFFTTIFNANR